MPTELEIARCARRAHAAETGDPDAFDRLQVHDRLALLAQVARFLDNPNLTIGAAAEDEIADLVAESWRWGWERNDQIKTEPLLIPANMQRRMTAAFNATRSR